MSKLSGFKDNTSSSGNPTGRPASSPPDKDRCPRGWDSDIWFLALLFEDLAEEQDIKLRAGRPVIYAELDSRIKASGIRNMKVPYTSEELEQTLNKDLYSERDPVFTGPLWREFVEAMVYEFWTRHWDENATATFSAKLMFIDIWDIIVRAVDALPED